MNTDQISSVLKTDELCHQIFKGVLARDQFISLSHIEPSSLFVCNLDNSNEPGSHWITVYFSPSGVEYFDSYGLPPIFEDLHKFLLRYDAKYTYNAFQLQSMDTTVCGSYCIIYALLRSRNFSLREVVSTFAIANDSHSRDHGVGAYVNSTYSTLIAKYGEVSDIHVQCSKPYCHYLPLSINQ